MSAEHYNATFLPDGDTADDEVEEHHGPQRCAFSPDCAHGLCTMRGREGVGLERQWGWGAPLLHRGTYHGTMVGCNGDLCYYETDG